MKKWFKRLFLTSLVIPITTSFNLLSSCATNKSWQIISHSSTDLYAEINKATSTAEIIIYGFEYNDLPGQKELTVIPNFSTPNVKGEVVELSTSTHSFNVKLTFYNCTKINLVSGTLQFVADNTSIKFDSPTYNIQIIEHKKIITSREKIYKLQLADGKASTRFTQFTYEGEIDETIECKFVTSTPIRIESKIVNIQPQFKTFDIQMEFIGCSSSDVIVGDFEFYFNKNLIEYITDKLTPFRIEFIEQKTIVFSGKTTSNVFYNGTKTSVIFSGFKFSGYTRETDIQAAIQKCTFQGTKSREFTPQIKNFSLENFSFDVELTDIGEDDVGVWNGQISFKIVDKIIATPTLTYNVYYSVPEDKLNIVEETSGQTKHNVLKGFVDGFDLTGTKYNTILIPINVFTIDDNAFAGKFTTDGAGKNITNLLFSDFTILTILGKGCFANCNAITNDLIIPDSVGLIAKNCFEGCSGMKGNLFIPYNPAKKLLIQTEAFKNCKFTSLDLSQYPLGVKPIWYQDAEHPEEFKDIFIGWDNLQTNKIIVCENVYGSEEWKTNFRTTLNLYSFPLDWAWAKN